MSDLKKNSNIFFISTCKLLVNNVNHRLRSFFARRYSCCKRGLSWLRLFWKRETCYCLNFFFTLSFGLIHSSLSSVFFLPGCDWSIGSETGETDWNSNEFSAKVGQDKNLGKTFPYKKGVWSLQPVFYHNLQFSTVILLNKIEKNSKEIYSTGFPFS